MYSSNTYVIRSKMPILCSRLLLILNEVMKYVVNFPANVPDKEKKNSHYRTVQSYSISANIGPFGEGQTPSVTTSCYTRLPLPYGSWLLHIQLKKFVPVSHVIKGMFCGIIYFLYSITLIYSKGIDGLFLFMLTAVTPK